MYFRGIVASEVVTFIQKEKGRKRKKEGREGEATFSLPSHFPNCSLSQSKMRRSIAACLPHE